MQNDIWKTKVISTYTVHIILYSGGSTSHSLKNKSKTTSINAQPKFKTLLRESVYLQISVH